MELNWITQEALTVKDCFLIIQMRPVPAHAGKALQCNLRAIPKYKL